MFVHIDDLRVIAIYSACSTLLFCLLTEKIGFLLDFVFCFIFCSIFILKINSIFKEAGFIKLTVCDWCLLEWLLCLWAVDGSMGLLSWPEL